MTRTPQTAEQRKQRMANTLAQACHSLTYSGILVFLARVVAQEESIHGGTVFPTPFRYQILLDT